MQARIKETKRLHKYMYEGMDDTLFVSGKRAITYHKRETFTNSPEGNFNPQLKSLKLYILDKSPTEKKRDKSIKKNSKNDFENYHYKKDNEILLNLPTPPFFFYVPRRLEMQMMIRKACHVKSINEMLFYI